MDRVLCIYLPQWDLEWIQRRRRGGRPQTPGSRRQRTVFLLVTEVAREQVVSRCCALAYRNGVFPGMALAEARALCPGAAVLAFDPRRSGEALDSLARWAWHYSPTVCVNAAPMDERPAPTPDGLLLDVTGEAHLFGSEYLLLKEIHGRLHRAGFTARLAVAPTLGAAWAVARFGGHAMSVLSSEHVEDALRPLPLACLRIPADQIAALQQVGVERVEHVLELPRESLRVRYGELILQRLDQALGKVCERFEPIRLHEPLALQRIFEGASTQIEAVTLTTKDLLAELSGHLLKQESGVRGLRVELARVDDPPVSREILLGRATRDAKHLWSLLQPKMENLHMGHGVEAVTLTAFWVARIRHQQLSVWAENAQGDAYEQEIEQLLDTLVNRWGVDRVLEARACASHVPERAQRFLPVRSRKQSRKEVQTELMFADRPSQMFERPELAQAIALQPDHPPSKLQWRGCDHALTAGAGPERINTEWWHDRVHSTRDYYKVQTAEGAWLWVFREMESAQWFVHGLWV